MILKQAQAIIDGSKTQTQRVVKPDEVYPYIRRALHGRRWVIYE